MGLTGVPNARLRGANAVLHWLDTAPAERSLADLRAASAAAEGAGVEPEALWQLADDLGYELDLSWHAAHPDGALDALFKRRDNPAALALRFPLPTRSPAPCRTYANDPLRGQLGERLVPELRRHLAAALPDYMVPASVTLLDAFPLTPNGKLDRKALPAPDAPAVAAGRAPSGEVEVLLATLWSELLGVEVTSAEADFFALGGHSLLATRLASRVR